MLSPWRFNYFIILRSLMATKKHERSKKDAGFGSVFALTAAANESYNRIVSIKKCEIIAEYGRPKK
jgi:hypothetical protein